jgi:outer membrane lipoprotein-sorting protein
MLKRIFIICFVLCTIIFVVKSLLYANDNFSSLQCDMVMEGSGMGVTRGKLFIKGDKVRMETDMPDETGGSTISLFNGEKAYIYFPSQNMAMGISTSQAKEQMPIPKDYKEIYKTSGEETIDGRLCDIYEYRDPKGQVCKIWVARDIEFPVQSIVGGLKTYYKNIRTNITLDDTLFSLPSGVKIQDMNELIQQMDK